MPLHETPTTTVQLRPYQAAAIEEARRRIARGARRLLFVAATGSGKTVLAGSIIESAAARGKRVLFLAHRRELINQAYGKLLDFGLPPSSVGVVMATDPRRRPGAPVQVASIDTLRHRARPAADLVFVDECDRALARSYRAIAADYPNAVHLGLTATPYRADGKGLGDAYDELVVVASPKQLIAEGFLVEPRVFTVPDAQRPDLSKVSVTRGDYTTRDLEQAVDRQVLIGNVVEHWLKHAAGVRTVAFAVSVAHSQHLVRRFVEAGVAAEHLDGTTPTAERDAILARLDAGATQVVSNVGVLCLDAETEILTSTGWVGIDGISMDHRVATWRNGVVQFERPREIHRRARMAEERMVRLAGRSAEFRVTEGHALVYRTGRHCAWMKAPARDRVGRAIELPACGRAVPLGVEVETRRPSSRRSIAKLIAHTRWNIRHLEGKPEREARSEAAWRVCRRLTLERRRPEDLTLAECAFIGFWLGDGSVVHLKRGGVEYKIFESSRNAEIVRWLDQVIDDLGISFIKRTLEPHERSREVKFRRTVPGYAWSFPRGTGGGSQAREGLFPLEPYLQRDGTWLYWGLDECQFDSLLHGIWMADGNHGQGRDQLPRSFVIHNARKSLLDCLQAIAVCRGYRTRLVPAAQPGMWRLSLSKREAFSLAPNQMTFEDGRPDERVWCVTTEAGNIVTRRRGVALVLGNCEGWDQPAVKCAILARPTKSTGLYLQQAGRILRPWQDQRAIILDHGCCAIEHGLPQDDREFTLEGRKKRAGQGGSAPVRTCPSCSAVVPIQTRVCPECGQVLFEEQDVPAETNSELVEVTAVSRPKRAPPRGPSIFETVREAARRGGRLSWNELSPR